MKPLRPLDPTWWRKAPGGYDQQDSRARLVRLKERTRVTGWGLYVDGEYRGSWPSLAQAKRRAAEMTEVATTTPSAGKCQPLGDPAASCTGTYPDIDGTYADCGDYDCPRHVPAASSAGQPAKPKEAS